MKGIAKTVTVVGQVLGLLVGSNFKTPAIQVMEQYTDLVVI